MHVAVFEPQSSGHRQEYLEHIVSYVSTGDYGGKLSVIRAQVSKRQPATSNQQLATIQISQKKSQNLLRGNMLARSYKYHRLAKKYAKEISPDHFVFLWLNDVQLMLGLFGFTCSASGILFKPFVRMERNSFRTKLVWFRKSLQTRLLASQKRLKRIWILGDQKAVEELNRRYSTDKFSVIPEPVHELESEYGYDVRQEMGVKKNRKIFLHVGTLSTRKGTPEIIESVKHISRELSNSLAILVVGIAQGGMENLIEEALTKTKERDHGVQLIYHYEFVPGSVLQSLFEQCDGVLIPYKNVESSSGILGHAVRNNKPVLGVVNGFLGEQIRGYENGFVINECTAKDIAQGITEMLQSELLQVARKTAKSNIDLNSSKIFAERLLGLR